MPVPAQPKIYHIVHVDNLASIVADGCLWSDAVMVQRQGGTVIGMGGIMTATDALEFLMAGASMVAVGTGNFVNPRAPVDVLEGIESFMNEHKISDIREIIGSLRK